DRRYNAPVPSVTVIWESWSLNGRQRCPYRRSRVRRAKSKESPAEVVSIPCLRISNAKQLLGSTVLCTCPWLTSQQRYFCCSTFCDTNGALETGAQFSPTLLPFFTTPIPSI